MIHFHALGAFELLEGEPPVAGRCGRLHHLRRALGESAIETRPDDQVRLAESGTAPRARGRRAEARSMYGRVRHLWRTADAPFRAIAAQAEARGVAE